MRLLSIAYTPHNRKRHLQFKECHHRHCPCQLTYPVPPPQYLLHCASAVSQCRTPPPGSGSTSSAWQMGSRFAVTTIQLSALIECLARRVEYHTQRQWRQQRQKTRETRWMPTDTPACLPASTCSCHIHTL